MEKTCNKCGVVLEERNWYPIVNKKMGKVYYYKTCLQCKMGSKMCRLSFVNSEINEYVKQRAKVISRQCSKLRNREEILRKAREYARKRKKPQRTPEVIEKEREYGRKRGKKNCKEMSDNYIKLLLHHSLELSFSEITPELIKLKRTHLCLKRSLKEI